MALQLAAIAIGVARLAARWRPAVWVGPAALAVIGMFAADVSRDGVAALIPPIIGGVAAAAVLAFQTAPVAPFVIAGVPIARDALLAEAGLDLAIGRNATVGVSYTGQIASNVQDHAAKGKFSWKF